MPKNQGKLFENDFKQSVPQECFYYRFKDNAASFSGGDNTRFTSSNIADCMVMTKEYLFILELKSHLGSSIGFNCIRKNQINQMSAIEHSKIKPYFILNFREKERTFAIESKTLKSFMETANRKSIPFIWCQENGIEIQGIKSRTRYKYNLEEFFNKMEG